MTNKQLYQCDECDGTGKYIVHNAYDLSYSEEVTCEYCRGTGYVEHNVEVPVVQVEVSLIDSN